LPKKIIWIWKNEDLEQQGYIFDEFNDDDEDDDEDNEEENGKEHQEQGQELKDSKMEDEFEWLKQNTVKDDDDDDDENENAKEESDKNNKNNTQNNIDKLFNLSAFPQKNDEQQSTNTIENVKDESKLSRFEKEEKAIHNKIAKLEEENLAERSWDLQGEATNKKIVRSKNSLLEKYFDFDMNDKLKPSITEDLTLKIENLIISKIENEQFDDVERKQDFANIPTIPKRKLIEIQDTKLSMGLAELYERQYLQQVEEAAKPSNNNDVTNDANNLTQRHERLARMKADLFYTLDQLYQFHYIPRADIVQSNINVKRHTKAMFMEEILPFAQNINNNNMTPEQIYSKPNEKLMVGENEMAKNEKKQKRRHNKQHSQEQKKK